MTIQPLKKLIKEIDISFPTWIKEEKNFAIQQPFLNIATKLGRHGRTGWRRSSQHSCNFDSNTIKREDPWRTDAATASKSKYHRHRASIAIACLRYLYKCFVYECRRHRNSGGLHYFEGLLPLILHPSPERTLLSAIDLLSFFSNRDCDDTLFYNFNKIYLSIENNFILNGSRCD